MQAGEERMVTEMPDREREREMLGEAERCHTHAVESPRDPSGEERETCPVLST